MEIDVKTFLALDNKISIDLRTAKEFDDGKIDQAKNYPIMNYDQRQEVSILYNQGNHLEAYKKSMTYANPQMIELLDYIWNHQDQTIVIYCSRGGLRSKMLYDILKNFNLENVYRLKEGYRGYRQFLLNYFEKHLDQFEFITFHGHSGVGKTNLLKYLATQGQDVLNFAALAENTGSAFGNMIYGYHDISQKDFDDKIFRALYYAQRKTIFTESESKRLGLNYINDHIFNKMKDGKHILLKSSLDKRAKNLYNNYVVNNKKFDKDKVIEYTVQLKRSLGKQKINALVDLLEAEHYLEAIRILLTDYYDDFYDYAIEKFEPYDLVIEADDFDEIYKKIKKEC
jgi:tRNA 2-selenouridine synthase